MALEVWGSNLKNKCVTLHSDNYAVVHLINQQTSKNSSGSAPGTYMYASKFTREKRAYSWYVQQVTRPSFPFTDFGVPNVSKRHGSRAHRSSTTSAASDLNGMMLELLNSSIAPTTKAVYRQAYVNYTKFHQTYFPDIAVFPINSLQIAKFISYCALQGLKGTTIQTHVACLNYFHNILGFTSPCNHFLVKKLLQGSKKLSNKPDKRPPITLSILKSLLACIGNMDISHYEKRLYKAMFLAAFFRTFKSRGDYQYGTRFQEYHSVLKRRF